MMLEVAVHDGRYLNHPELQAVENYSPAFFNRVEKQGKKMKTVMDAAGRVMLLDTDFSGKGSYFETWFKQIKSVEPVKNYSFKSIHTRLSKEKKQQRVNADLRTFISYKEFLMVKNLFTFGLMTVPDMQRHFIVTFGKTLDVYIPKVYMDFKNRYLDPKWDDDDLLKETLIPYHTFEFPPKIQYILVSPTKSIFLYKAENLIQGVPLQSDLNPSGAQQMEEQMYSRLEIDFSKLEDPEPQPYVVNQYPFSDNQQHGYQ